MAHLLKATKEVRDAFDFIGEKDYWKESAEIIIQYLHSKIQTQQKNGECNISDFKMDKDVEYVLQRLTKGIMVNKNFLHHGCYATIKYLLDIFPFMAKNIHLVLLKNQLKSNDLNLNVKKILERHENKELGNALIYGAMIKSGCLLKKENLSIVTDAASVLKLLIEKSVDYSFFASQFLIELLHMALANDNKEVIVSSYEALASLFTKPIEKHSIAQLWLRFVLCGEKCFKHIEQPSDIQNDLFEKSNFLIIYKKINVSETSNLDSEMVLQIYKEFFDALVFHFGETNGSKRIATLIKASIISSLPLPNQKFNKRISAYIVLQATIPHLKNEEHIRKVLCSSLMSEFLSVENPQPGVSKYFKALLKSLSNKISSLKEKDENGLQIVIIKCLLEPPLSVMFDSTTKSNVLMNSAENLNEENRESFCEFMLSLLDNDQYEEKENESSGHFLTASLLLSRCLSQSAVLKGSSSGSKIKLTSRFIKHVFFRKHPKKEAELLKDIFRKCYECNSSKIEDHVNFTNELISEISTHVSKNGQVLKPELLQFWRNVIKSRQQAASNCSKASPIFQNIFTLFYNEVCLDMFIKFENAQEMFFQLEDCFKGLLAAGELKKNKIKSCTEVVDLLLAVLSRADHNWRRIVVLLFNPLCVYMKASDLSLITDIINPLKKDEFMFTDEGIEMDGEDEEESGEEDEEDESGEEDEEDESTDEQEEDSEGLNDDEDEEMSSKDEKKLELLELKQKMQVLAGFPADEDVDMDSVPQEELDNLSRNLGALMKSYFKLTKKPKNKKLKLAKDETDLMHFRIRACDLLEEVVKTAPSLKIVCLMIEPLMQGIKECSKDKLQTQFRTKLKSILQDLSRVNKFVREDSNSVSIIAEKVTSLFKTFKNQTNISKEIDLCLTFLLRNGLALSEENQENVVISSYITCLDSFLTNTTTHSSSFVGSLSIESGALVDVLEAIVSRMFTKSGKLPAKLSSCQLVVTLLRNEKSCSLMDKKKLKAQMKILSTALIEYLDSITEDKKVQGSLLCAYFDVIKAVKVLNKHMEKIETWFDWDGVETAMSNLDDRVGLKKPKSLHNGFKSITEFLSISIKSKGNPTKISKMGILKHEKKMEKKKRKLESTSDSFQSKKKRRKENKKRNNWQKQNLLNERHTLPEQMVFNAED